MSPELLSSPVEMGIIQTWNRLFISPLRVDLSPDWRFIFQIYHGSALSCRLQGVLDWFLVPLSSSLTPKIPCYSLLLPFHGSKQLPGSAETPSSLQSSVLGNFRLEARGSQALSPLLPNRWWPCFSVMVFKVLETACSYMWPVFLASLLLPSTQALWESTCKDPFELSTIESFW